MDRCRAPRIVGTEQHGLQESTPVNRGLGIGIARDDTSACGLELADPIADVVTLADADKSPHAGVLRSRVADLGPCEPLGERLFNGIEILCRSHGAADGGAFLSGLDR